MRKKLYTTADPKSPLLLAVPKPASTFLGAVDAKQLYSSLVTIVFPGPVEDVAFHLSSFQPHSP